MQNILEKARELGQAIAESEEQLNMRAAEDAVMEDAQASTLMREYSELKIEVQQMLESESPDEEALSAKSDRLQEAQDQLNDLPLVQRMLETRGEFAQMMAQVNQVIQFMVTGETSDCGGDCGGCSGCGHTH